MAIEKLLEFAKDGQKNTDDLNLTDGFHVSKKPARQWFNWLFNTLTSKVNEIIDADFIPKSEIVNNLTTDDAKKPLSAKQGKLLSEVKVNKTGSFKDAFSSDLDYYVDRAATSDYGFTSCADFPLGTRILVASNLNFADFPVLDSNYVYIETKKTFDNPGKQQIAYGYTTGSMAIRVAATGSAYGLWKYIAFQDSNITGNAASATKLQNPRTVSFSGAVTGSFSYDGSGNSSALLTLANSGVLAGTYGSPLKIPVITVNQKGLVTVVAEQNIPVGLEKNQLMKAGSARITSSASLEQFLNNYYGLSVPFFENGAASLFGQFSAGLVSSYEGGGTFAFGASVIDGRVYGVAAPENRLADAMRFEFYTTRSLQFNGNAVSASKLQNPRMIFGQTFDGTGDVGGTVTASTGLVQSDEYHYIDMGRSGLDRMNFYNHGAIFNFIDSQNGNIVARITQNGIDCNAATASKLKTPRKINGVNFDGSIDIDLPLIGIGQTWQDVSSLRLDGVTYTNTSPRTITVFFGGGRQGVPAAEFHVGDEIFALWGGGSEPDEVYFSIPIQPGETYGYKNKPQYSYVFRELK